MIVLDTNVLSELMRPEPSAGVSNWVSAQPSPSLFTTTVSQAEILYGIALLPEGRRKGQLETAVAAMFEEELAGRVLPFDAAAAQAYAAIAADRRRAGRRISAFDAQIAAICRSRGAFLATRNVSDFAGCGIDIVDPWAIARESAS